MDIESSEEKEIWRMTRKQYYEEVHPKAVKEYEKKLLAWNSRTKDYQSINEVLSPEKNKVFMINSYEDIYMQGHKEAVMQAIEEGKDVPEEVRKEYELKGRKYELKALLNNCVDDDKAILLERELEGLEEKNE